MRVPDGVVSVGKAIAAAAGEARKPTQAAVLVKLARAMYDIVVDRSGQSYAVAKRPPRRAIPLQGRSALTGYLTREFFERTGSPPNPTALRGAVQVLEAQAMDDERVTVHLRAARTSDGLVIDLGDASGQVIVIGRGRWTVRPEPPEGVYFRRSRLTAPLPRPSRRGDLGRLRELLSVSDADWDLIRSWLVLAWMSHIPVPILAITGQQGAGKSVLGRTLVSIVDPSSAPLRSSPKNVDDWQTTANASRVVGLDNISRINEWLSDAFCRAVTGEGAAKRQLYTDEDLIVQTFRRAIVLTSIDPGSLRGDLGERLMPVELGRLGDRRRGEAELDRELERRMPTILGGLCDLVAAVLARPVRATGGARMADAANVIASVDGVLGSDALAAYRRAQANVVYTVLESDPVAMAVVAFMRSARTDWEGTPNDLYGLLGRDGERNWPANARGLSERLMRLAPGLRDAHQLDVTRFRGDRRLIRIARLKALPRRPRAKPRVKRTRA